MKRHIYEPEYSSDFMRWADFSAQYFKGTFSNQTIEQAQEKIVKEKDSALAYYFANEIGYKNYKMQNIILNNKSAKYGILFAQNIKNADTNALQNMIIETKQMKYICKLGCFVPGADIKRIEKIILESKKSAKWAHMFIKNIKGANPHKFKKIIIESGKPRYLYELAKHLKSKRELNIIQDLIIESKSATYIRLFAENIKSSNVEKLEEAILKLDDIEEIKKFATYVKKSKMRNFIIMF